MKISNKKNIKYYFRFIVFLMTGLFSFTIYILSAKNILDYFFPYTFLLFVLLGIILSKVKYFEYDSSGEIVSIKHFYLWNRFQNQYSFEVPKSKIINYQIIKRQFCPELILYIESRKARAVKNHFRIHGLTKKQLRQIEKSLHKIQDR